MVSVQRTHHIYMASVLLFSGVFIYVSGSSAVSACEEDEDGTALSSKGKTNMMFTGIVMFISACISALRFRSPTVDYSCQQQRPRNLLRKQITSLIKKDYQLLLSEILNIIIYISMSFVFAFFVVPDVHSSLMLLWHDFLVNNKIFSLEYCNEGQETLDWVRYVLFFFLIGSVTMVFISVHNFFLVFQAYRMNVHLKRTMETSDAESCAEEMQVINPSPDQPPAYEP